MVAQSIPQIIYKYQSDVESKQQVAIEVTITNDLRMKKFEHMKCVTRKLRKEYRLTHSYTPMSMAMKVYDNPSIDNRQMSEYVDRYVSRLK